MKVSSQATPNPGTGALPLSLGTVSAALLCAMLWGGNSVAVKFALAAFPPFFMAAARFILAACATACWCGANRLSVQLTGAQVPIALVNGLFLFAQIGTFTVGTEMSSSIHSIILINSYPFFTAIATHFWLPAFSLTGRKVLGLVIAFVGVLSLFATQLSAPDRTGLVGDAILLFSAMILGIKFTYVKTVLHRIAVPTVVFWEATLAVPMFLFCGWLFESVSVEKMSATTLAAVGYQGLAVSAVAFVIWTRLLSRHSPNDLAAISFTTPLFGMLAGWALLGEPLTLSLLAGGCLIMLGIYCINAR